VGYDVVVTGYSDDGGIDIILTTSGQEIGVQVKRYRSTIKVDKIRELAGALVLRGMTKGIFVTTSDFQRGGTGVVKQLASRGFAVQLLNADAFYEALRLSQRSIYANVEDFLAQHDLRKLHYVDRPYRGFFPKKDFAYLLKKYGGVYALRHPLDRHGPPA
jgi:hypothetical protein